MEKPKILVVEDDPDIQQLVQWHLKAADFQVLAAGDGRLALEMAWRDPPDLVLLDLMLPEVDGLEVCKSLKRDPRTAAVPVLMLTARGEEADRILGLELGADDYIVKPFSPRELVLRVQAILRRAREPAASAVVLQREGLKIDLESHQVWIDQAPVELTATEFKLLLHLMQNRGRVQSRDQLLDRVWGYQFDGYARTVDTHIRRLRQKIGPYADWIETLRGVGYRFRD